MKRLTALLSLLLIITAISVTAFGQSSTQDKDSINYTARQDSNCLRCLAIEQKRAKTDSLNDVLIELYKSQLVKMDSLRNVATFQRDQFKHLYDTENEKLLNAEVNLGKCQNRKKTVPVIAGIGGAVLGWIFRKAVVK